MLRSLVLCVSSDQEPEPRTYPRSPLRYAFNEARATQLLCPFVHGTESNATAYPWWQSLPVVSHLHHQGLLYTKMNGRRGGMGMTHDIGQRLLHNPVTGHLGRGGQRGKRLWSIQRQHNAARMVLRHLLLYGRQQAQLVESRRTERIDQATNIGNRLLCMGGGIGQQLFCCIGVLAQQLLDCGQCKCLARELRTQSIVQIPPQTSPFLLTCCHQALTGTL